jgi:hypothetical protein
MKEDLIIIKSDLVSVSDQRSRKYADHKSLGRCARLKATGFRR